LSDDTTNRGSRRGRGGDEMLVITRAYDLVREVTDRVRRFPRDLRFVLGDRMLSTVFDVLDALIEARYTADRARLLRAANLGLERLRFQMRLAADLHLLSVVQYEQMAERIQEVGRMVGGWTKASG